VTLYHPKSGWYRLGPKDVSLFKNSDIFTLTCDPIPAKKAAGIDLDLKMFPYLKIEIKFIYFIEDNM
jgi:hypothetical protein